ncbi:hypothetical protein Acr_10g0010430 [Actinidia rufa]|uniref:DNAse I-like superfamily protein n=1 Tax=Actinidia rufa TaxID=165716 RepID=A0A7J0FAC7_9ERIC|nr:hypothetical protein Acr_10g0010430 [Actinidia rufa]
MINHIDTKNVEGGNKDNSGNRASFVEILQGKGALKEVPQTVKIKAREVGNGWLLRSAVAKIPPYRSLMMIQQHLRSVGHLDIQVRHMCGDWVVLTFPTGKDLLSMLGEVGKNKASTAIMEPINKVINLEVNGVLFPFWVCEEQVVTNLVSRIKCNCIRCKEVGVEEEVFSQETREEDNSMGESEANDHVLNEVVDTYEGKADRNVHEMGVSDMGIEVVEWVKKSSSKFAENGFPEADVEVGVANVVLGALHHMRGVGEIEEEKEIHGRHLRGWVKKITREHKVDFVLLQESKLENVNRGMVHQLWKDDDFDFVEVRADGSAGGLLCFWDLEIFSLEEV